jgi:hypothetical protein
MYGLYQDKDTIGRKLLLIKKKKIQYKPDQVMRVFEFLEDETLHPQEIAKQTEFSARQIKKLRYIKRHMTKVEFEVLMDAKYYISSMVHYIKYRISVEKDLIKRAKAKGRNNGKD